MFLNVSLQTSKGTIVPNDGKTLVRRIIDTQVFYASVGKGYKCNEKGKIKVQSCKDLLRSR